MIPTTRDIAIIGAGTAGCFTARTLTDAGFNCCLIEKSRGLGGRCSRRRVDDDYGIDLGAPELSVGHITNPALREQVSKWLNDGLLSKWIRRTATFANPAKTEPVESFCAVPSMNAWHKDVAKDIACFTGQRAHTLKRLGHHWHIFDENRQLICKASKLVVATPAEQAFTLLAGINDLGFNPSRFGNNLPQYVCALAFPESLQLGADMFRGEHDALDTAVREDSKPSRIRLSEQHEVWVLQSTHTWAQQQAHREHQHAGIDLAIEFCEHFNISAPPRILTSHYWRLARHKVSNVKASSFLWNDVLQIGCCGDWLDGGDIQGAITSSLGLAKKIIMQN
ncbi:NAD(P)/FAD-dependent oxidoreductase [Zhongshania sp. BJYM1]|uniref:NAD(P)/FAD-dependent oxidoreductase n=1 Tax=Zhongshania aquatica TaxID=2965069 RepID=UPI0022B3FB43|nr:FAD-dependent oxidoreductase [Marortus sp. BJYM1]